MRTRRELTVRKFGRKHPDVCLAITEDPEGVCVIARETSGDQSGSLIAERHGPAGSRDRLLCELSGAVLAIRRLEVARFQAYRDAQTGEIKPLQTHHVVFRSHGGSHARRNLVGLSAETHRVQHEGKRDSGPGIGGSDTRSETIIP